MKYKKTFTFFFFLVIQVCFSQISMVTWNVKHFGKSKTEEQLNKIADLLKNHDLVAIQEVVASNAGARAVSKLARILNEKGAKWDYAISHPTQSTGQRSERYAYFWKTSKLKLKGSPFLEDQYANQIEREPFLATFIYENKIFSVVNFHALPKKSQPETEIKYFKFFKNHYNGIVFFVGDFNLPQSHSVFNPIKKDGFKALFENQKTTLKQKCKGNVCLANPLDHIFYDVNKVNIKEKGAILFYEDYENIQEARKLTDHIPIYIKFTLN